MYKQAATYVYLGATVCEKADLTVEINRRVLLAHLRFGRYGLRLYEQLTAPLPLTLRMFKAEAMKSMLYGCHVEPHRGLSRHTADSSPSIAPPLHQMEEKPRDGYHMLSHADALAKTGCENVGTTVRKRRILSAGFVAHMGSERLPKRVMFWELEGGKG